MNEASLESLVEASGVRPQVPGEFRDLVSIWHKSDSSLDPELILWELLEEARRTPESDYPLDTARRVVAARHRILGLGGLPINSESSSPLNPPRLDGLNPLLAAGDHPPWSTVILEQALALTYDKAKSELSKVLVFPDSSDYDAFLLSLGQTYLIDFLDKTWHLAFSGPKSAGKSTSTRIWAYLGDEVYLAGRISPGALPAVMSTAHGLAIDEIDSLIRHSEAGQLIEGYLRSATDRDQPYIKTEERSVKGEGIRHVPVAVPTFGAAAFNFTGKVDPALMSRTDKIEMPRMADPAEARRRAKGYKLHLAPVKAWIEAQALAARTLWTRGRIAEYEASTRFLTAAAALPGDLPRTHEIGEGMLIVAEIFGWPAGGAIRSRMDAIDRDSTEDDVEEVRGAILAMLERGEGWDEPRALWKLPVARIRQQVDDARSDPKQRGIHANTVAAALRELGLRKVERVHRTRDRRQAVLATLADRERLSPSVAPIYPGPVGSPGTTTRRAGETSPGPSAEPSASASGWPGPPPSDGDGANPPSQASQPGVAEPGDAGDK